MEVSWGLSTSGSDLASAAPDQVSSRSRLFHDQTLPGRQGEYFESKELGENIKFLALASVPEIIVIIEEH